MTSASYSFSVYSIPIKALCPGKSIICANHNLFFFGKQKYWVSLSPPVSVFHLDQWCRVSKDEFLSPIIPSSRQIIQNQNIFSRITLLTQNNVIDHISSTYISQLTQIEHHNQRYMYVCAFYSTGHGP